MKASYQFENCAIVPSLDEQAPIVVYATPGDIEKLELIATLQLDPHDMESALDPDEISRVEFTPDRISLIWKRPKSALYDQHLRLDVSSVGLFLLKDKFIVVTNDEAPSLSDKEYQGAQSSVDVLLRFLLHTVRHYLGHLKVIKQLTVELESKVSASMENRYLLQMFALGESLIYYLNAIEANGSALTKLRTGERLGLTKQQAEFLDDLLLDNAQCARQAQIYSDVLSGLMDVRGTIINNNISVLLKNLTLINIIFLPLNLIAGIGGMSEYSMMTHGTDWRVSFSLFVVGMGALGWATWVVLNRYIDNGAELRRGR
jgi:magnesium transporter